MAALVNWQTETSVLVCPGTGDSDTDLLDLATTEGILTAAIDNRSLNQYIMFELKTNFDSAPLATAYFSLWMIRSIDGGTIYETGSVASRVVTAAIRPADVVFPMAAVATEMVVTSPLLLAPPCHFKILLVNNTLQDLENSSGASTLRYVFANDESQ